MNNCNHLMDRMAHHSHDVRRFHIFSSLISDSFVKGATHW